MDDPVTPELVEEWVEGTLSVWLTRYTDPLEDGRQRRVKEMDDEDYFLIRVEDYDGDHPERFFRIGIMVEEVFLTVEAGNAFLRLQRTVEAGNAFLRLQRIAEAHTKHVGPGGMTSGFCNECDHLYPCPTYVWATDHKRNYNAAWDPADDKERSI